MKKIVLLLLTSFACSSILVAQGLGQFLDQQATELKYYEQQIAYLQLYIGYLQKGFQIAQSGLSEISAIKKGEFNLHQRFFSSLATVNPQISRYARVADIISMQLSIISNFKQALQPARFYSSPEISYLQSVYSNLVSECSKNLTELIAIITDGTLTLHDDERIRRIDNIYAETKDQYAFSQSFTGEASLLSAQRADELNEIEFLNQLY
jgi:hypothetical protein